MKYLYLTRHSKSSWENSAVEDFERTLKVDRINDAKTIVDRLIKLGYKTPEIIVYSNSIRTSQTAHFLRNFWRERIEMLETPLLYDAGMNEILQVISSISDNYNIVQVVGHNPGFTEFANVFCGGKILNLVTTGTIVFTFKTFGDFNKSEKIQVLDYLKPTQ